jgi:hypothetical protein
LLVLVDASGSMQDRLAEALAAAVAVRDAMPPDAPVVLGSFAGQTQWWPQNQPPPTLAARGETNLRAALDAAAELAASFEEPGTLLLLTDSQTPLSSARPPANLRVDVLHVGDAVDASLRRLVEATGGTIAVSLAAGQLDQAARSAAGRADVVPARDGQATLTLLDGALSIAGPWREAAVRPEATRLSGPAEPPAAVWRVGAGRVVSVAADVPASAVERLADELAGEATTTVQVEVQPDRLIVTDVPTDAAAVAAFVNDRSINGTRTGPRAWRIDLPRPRPATTAVLLIDGKRVAAVAVASSYPREFDAIGNDVSTLRQLAGATGGSLAARAEDLRLERVDHERSAAMLLLFLAAFLATGAAVAVVRPRPVTN